MKIALVNDWLLSSVGGGEKVIEALHEIYSPPIFTLLTDKEKLKGTPFEKCKITPSFIQNLPFARKKYRSYLPLFPMAIEQFDFSDYEVILSCSHSVAKGAITHFNQLHICYCYTPMRYAWDLYHQYLNEANLQKGWKGKLAKFILHYIRMWDTQSASRVDEFVAISHFIAKRIQKIYGKKASVIYPPVRTNFFTYDGSKDHYYITASRFVPYKKVDLIVEAFSKLTHLKLVVIGDGPERKKIEAKASKNIELLGEQPDDVLKKYLQKAKAFVFASIEDFGILPLEAQSCGTPVIALAKGGALETVVENKTGIFFNEQTVSSLVEAVQVFEKKGHLFDLSYIHKHAGKFSVERFKQEMKEYIDQKYLEYIQ